MTAIVGMASNRGRNLRNVADRAPGGATVAAVLTNDADAPVLEAAADRGIPTEVVEREPGEDRRSHERRVVAALEGYEFDLVCLDGYMRILSDTFLSAVPTTLNVHPSLLPSFPGMDAHEQVLSAGVRVTGATVHVVTDATDEAGEPIEGAVDSGPVVTQEPVPVYEGDAPADLKERVLYEGEFRAYPRAVRWFAEDRVEVDRDAGTVAVEGDAAGRFPARRVVGDDRAAELRYGENPHQRAALYVDATADEAGVAAADQLNPTAKGTSYNNYNDAEAGVNLAAEFDRPAAVVVKHTNPAGCATAETLAEAYDRALSTDPKSAFGGVVALNRTCDAETAEGVTDSFKEVVAAPGFTDDALAVLREKENLRVLDVGRGPAGGDAGPSAGLGERTERLTEKDLVGGRLVQERDLEPVTRGDLEVVTDRAPADEEYESLLFAWRTVKHVKSNAIVFATGTETVGVGAGQMSRVDAVKIARMKAAEDAEGKDAEGAVMASDAFFPFPDAVEAAAEAGVEAVIQPGGSVNDDDVIAAADDLGLAMVLTGQRCFRHD